MSQKQRSMLFQLMAPRPRKPSEMCQKKAPMFFKFMLPGFSQKLCLPRAFLKHLKGDKCDKAILKCPLGKSWHVKVCGGNACKWFGDGWFDFVQGHDLQLGECLVFRYDGNMVFHVIAFATSACEKRIPVLKKDDKDDGKQRGREDEKKTPLVRERVKDKGKQRGQHVSTAKINGFKKNVPSFFSREHLPKEKNILFLWDLKWGAWEVTFTPGINQNGYLSGGWSEFSRAHDLRVGDVCIFELVGECQLQVHIFPWKMPAFAHSKRLKTVPELESVGNYFSSSFME